MPKTATFDTDKGTVTAELFDEEAPNTVANFEKLANSEFYDGTRFHRVIKNFMIQGGDPAGNGTGDPGYKFKNEVSADLLFDQPGRLAYANSGPNTNGSQFFVTEQGYDTLNGHYTLFGQCDDASVEVVKAIARVPRDGDDKPRSPVILQKVTIVPEGQPLPPDPNATPALKPPPAAPKP